MERTVHSACFSRIVALLGRKNHQEITFWRLPEFSFTLLVGERRKWNLQMTCAPEGREFLS